MARPRGTPVFTVEVKRTKKAASVLPSPDQGRDQHITNWTSDLDASSSASSSAVAASETRQPLERSNDEATKRIVRRILPSLVTAEKDNQNARAEFKPPVTPAAPRTRTSSKSSPAEPTTRSRHERAAPASANVDQAAVALPAPVTAAEIAAPANQPTEPARAQRDRRMVRLSALGRLRRRYPVSFRRGERWKQRLPRACR
jgi:hypothetical protein